MRSNFQLPTSKYWREWCKIRFVHILVGICSDWFLLDWNKTGFDGSPCCNQDRVTCLTAWVWTSPVLLYFYLSPAWVWTNPVLLFFYLCDCGAAFELTQKGRRERKVLDKKEKWRHIICVWMKKGIKEKPKLKEKNLSFSFSPFVLNFLWEWNQSCPLFWVQKLSSNNVSSSKTSLANPRICVFS